MRAAPEASSGKVDPAFLGGSFCRRVLLPPVGECLAVVGVAYLPVGLGVRCGRWGAAGAGRGEEEGL